MTEYSEDDDILPTWHLNFQLNDFHKSNVLLAGSVKSQTEEDVN